MNWIKNIVLVAVSIAVTVAASNFLVGIYLDYYKSSKTWVLDDNAVELYRAYENQINHLRNPSIGTEAPHLNEVTDLIFTDLPQQGASISVLISGDSWGEKFATDVESYQTLRNFSKREVINLTLSGTSSYSPTLLGIQSRILKSDFDLSFDEVFVVVDNTDIGDELCRYRNFIAEDKNGDKIVKKFVAEDKMLAYTNDPILYISEVLSSSDYALKKFGLLGREKLESYGREYVNCGWTDISKYLYEITEDNVQYFEGTLEYMIEEIRRSSPSANIHILTIPHRKHVTGEYKISTSMLVKDFLSSKNFRQVKHHDFSDNINQLLLKGYSLDEIFIAGDRASHLTSFSHNKILLPFITSTLGMN